MRFWERLKYIRIKKDISPSKLSTIAGLHSGAISYYEEGRSFPGLPNIKKICKALECKPNDLIDVDDCDCLVFQSCNKCKQ